MSRFVPRQVDDALLAAYKESFISKHHSNPDMMARRVKVREVLQQALSSYGPNTVITAVHTRHGVCVGKALQPFLRVIWFPFRQNDTFNGEQIHLINCLRINRVPINVIVNLAIWDFIVLL